LPPGSTSLISVALDPPPQPKERLKASGSTENGRAAPPSLKAEAAPVVAPLRITVPPRSASAAITPAASVGVKAGAATQPGAGSGAGGLGTGTGSGNGGTGTGDGNGDGAGGGSDAEWTGGKIRDKDYPKALREANISGTTVTEVAVSSTGRAAACRVTRSSGNRELDTTTCQLIMERFRFKPARNAAGQAVASQIEYEQEWDAPPPPPP
jgi:protein TonB